MGAPIAPTYTVNHYEFYQSNGTTQVGTADTQTTLDTDTTYYCVMSVFDTTANKANDVTIQWQFNLAGGGWTTVGTTTAVQFANGSLTDGDTTQTAKTAETGTFRGSRVYESANTTAIVWSTPGDETDNFGEHWLGFTIDSAQVSDGQEVLLRATLGDGTAFDVYNVNADIDINEPVGSQTINADYLASSSAVNQPTITTVVTLNADYLASSSVVYEPSLSIAQTINTDYLAGSSQVHEPTLSTVVTIQADYLAGVSTGYEPTFTTLVTLDANYLASAAVIYQPNVSIAGGTQNLNADYLSSNAVVYEPTISSVATINADYVGASSLVQDPTLSSVVTLFADYASSSSQVHEPSVTLQTQIIEVDFVTGASQVYQPNITGGEVQGGGGRKKRKSTLSLPDGTLVTVDSKAEAQRLLDEYYQTLQPEVKKPKVVRRTVKVKEDDKTYKVAIFTPPTVTTQQLQTRVQPIISASTITAEQVISHIKRKKRQRDEEALLLLIA